KQTAHGKFRAAHCDSAASARSSATTSRCAGHTRANAQNSAKNSHSTGTAKLLTKSMLMATSKVGCLVGNNADDFIWRFRLHQSTRINENAATINKRIE